MVKVVLLVQNTSTSRIKYGHIPVKIIGIPGLWSERANSAELAIGRGKSVPDNTSRSLNGLKILVVDDSKTIRRTAETLLSKEGCQVFTAIDGFDALSKIGPAVSLFGSARTNEDSEYYKAAQKTAKYLSENGLVVITGGGPGIMAAGNRGASEAGGISVGLNIHLPFEQTCQLHN